MTSITKIRIDVVPSVEEMNAILFDMQQEKINIVNVELKDIYPSGDLCFLTQYHIQIQEALSEELVEEENGK